jgi:hypothetical protein
LVLEVLDKPQVAVVLVVREEILISSAPALLKVVVALVIHRPPLSAVAIQEMAAAMAAECKTLAAVVQAATQAMEAVVVLISVETARMVQAAVAAAQALVTVGATISTVAAAVSDLMGKALTVQEEQGLVRQTLMERAALAAQTALSVALTLMEERMAVVAGQDISEMYTEAVMAALAG